MKILKWLGMLVALSPVVSYSLPLKDGIYDDSPVSNLTGELMICDEPLIYDPTSLKKVCREDLVQREEEQREEEADRPVTNKVEESFIKK